MNPKPSLVSPPGGGPRRLQDAARNARAAAIYFALVFGAGSALGLIRVPLLVPRLGERYAELLEMPPMFAVIVLAAGWLVRRFRLDAALSDALCVGFGALMPAVLARRRAAAVLWTDRSPRREPE